MSIISVFKKIGGWFEKQELSVEKLFKKIEPVLEQTQGYVEKLTKYVDAETIALGSPAVLTKVEALLHAEINVYETVNNFVIAHKNAPVQSILHDAAVLLVKSLPSAAGLVLNELDLAVQTAYSVTKVV